MTGPPLLAGLLGPAAASGTRGAQRHDLSAGEAHGQPSSPSLATAAPAVEPASEGGSGLLLPALAAVGLAALLAAALRPGLSLTAMVVDRRMELAMKRRHAELVTAVHGILGERDAR